MGPMGFRAMLAVQKLGASTSYVFTNRRRALIFLLGAACVLVAVGYALRLLTGETIAIVRFAGYFAPWVFVSMALVSLCALVLRVWILLVASLVLSALIASPYLSYYLPGDDPEGLAEKPFLVMSFNTMGRNDDAERIASVVRANLPDLVLLQEVLQQDELTSQLSDLYGERPVYFAGEPPRGLLIVSRFPLQELTGELGVQRVIGHTPCGNINIWNLRGPKTFSGIDAQYEFVSAFSQKATGGVQPTLIAGDFNFTEASVPYLFLRTHLQSAQEDGGFGFGPTFPAEGRSIGRFLPPLIRIDHIFYNEALFATKSWVGGQSGGSDHYPVIAELDWTGDECDR